MYHHTRALVYFMHGGDDHEAHSKVATGIPNDFNDKADWQNKLRNARLDRNRADYDPFPLADGSYKPSAQRVMVDALALAVEVKAYLRAKGLVI